MVVAGAEVAVADELAALAAHHLAHLGVGLQLDEAEDHLRPGPLEVAGPADIGFFVEARLEFDQRASRTCLASAASTSALTIGLSREVR